MPYLVSNRRQSRCADWTPTHIRLLRHHCGLTQKEMGGYLTILPRTIVRWERGLCAPQPFYCWRLERLAKRAGFWQTLHPPAPALDDDEDED